MSTKSKKQYDFLKNATSINSVEVNSNKVPTFRAPDKGVSLYFDFPFVTEDGSFPVEKVTFFRIETIGEDGKERYNKIKKPEDEKLTEELLKIAEPVTRYTTVVLELSGRMKGTGKDKRLSVTDVVPKVLVLDDRKITALQTIVANNDISTIDITVTSNNPSFQEMSFIASTGQDGEASYKSCPVFESDEEIDELLDDAASLFEEGWKAVCKEYSEAKIKQLIKQADSDYDELDEDEEEAPRKNKFSKKADDDELDDEEEAPRKSKFSKKADYEEDYEDADTTLNKRFSRKAKEPEEDDEEDYDDDDEPEEEEVHSRRSPRR